MKKRGIGGLAVGRDILWTISYVDDMVIAKNPIFLTLPVTRYNGYIKEVSQRKETKIMK